MAKYIVDSSDMTDIADAIRAKGGTSDPLVYPAGFISAIENMSTGGVTVEDTLDEHGGTVRTITATVYPRKDENDDVVFIDYDGTVVASYNAYEFSQLTAMPDNPSHPGLIAQGWNWTLAHAKAHVADQGELIIGQMYITTSGATEIDIELDDPNFLSPYLMLAIDGEVSVDWGDGSTPDTMTGYSLSATYFQQHIYSEIGNYTISISVANVNNDRFGFYSSSSTASPLKDIRSNSYVYASTIKNIRLGYNCHIKNYGFYRCSSLETITFPSELPNDLGYNSFEQCGNLKSAIIPNSVNISKIDKSVFRDCKSLRIVSIPKLVLNIGTHAFHNCFNMQRVTIPHTTNQLSSYAFSNCYCLKKIIIPISITYIDSYVFYCCYALEEIVFINTIANIWDYSFYNCVSLKKIRIPSDTTRIGDYAFYNCVSLESIDIPNTVTYLGERAFYNCYNLQNIAIPENNTYTSIRNYLCYYAFGLKSIMIPDTITQIGSLAFYCCFSLDTIIIPESVTIIDSKAFSSCSAMRAYHLLAETPPNIASDSFENIPTDCIIYVPYSSDHSVLTAYQTANNWSVYATYMQEEAAS